jgi:hypothetical protein
MMRKALIIAMESLEFILRAIPADADGKLAEMRTSFVETTKHLEFFKSEMEKERHEWSVKAMGEEKCPCEHCDADEAEDVKLMDKCLREAVLDDFNQCVEVQLPVVKSDTAETPLNTSATETQASCVA